jgi:regulator of sigma E protease
LLTILAFLIVIGVLVFVHEVGHLIAAKSVDIQVPRFSIGFGPRIWGFRRGETEYVVSALPLGGYVRMAGMEDTAMLEGPAEPEPAASGRDFESKSLLARTWVVSAGVLMNFIFAIITFAAVAFFYGEPIIATTRVAVEAPEGAPAVDEPLASVPLGAELAAIDGRPVDSWNDVVELLSNAPAGPVDLRFADGGAITLDLPADDSARSVLLTPLQPFTPPLIGEVEPGSVAARAGFQPGDLILEVAGSPVSTWSEFVRVVRASPGREVELVVQRDGALVPLTVVPEPERELNIEMERVEIGRIGVGQQFVLERRPVGAGAALERGARITWQTTSAIVVLLGDLLTGDASPRSLGGPLAIGQLSGQAARGGMEAFFQFMALLSVNLAVLNLLPIPVLDGGQLLFLGIEALRGKPLSIEQRLRLANIGVILVIGIMVWAITNDFLRYFGI